MLVTGDSCEFHGRKGKCVMRICIRGTDLKQASLRMLKLKFERSVGGNEKRRLSEQQIKKN